MRGIRQCWKAAGLMFAGLMMPVTPALADRIDGDWCSADGRHLRIDGPRIMIPSGAEIAGRYDRHHFSYEGPEADPEAGQLIEMRQLSDQEMRLKRIPRGEIESIEPAEIWRRCQAVS